MPFCPIATWPRVLSAATRPRLVVGAAAYARENASPARASRWPSWLGCSEGQPTIMCAPGLSGRQCRIPAKTVGIACDAFSETCPPGTACCGQAAGCPHCADAQAWPRRARTQRPARIGARPQQASAPPAGYSGCEAVERAPRPCLSGGSRGVAGERPDATLSGALLTSAKPRVRSKIDPEAFPSAAAWFRH